MSKPQTTDYDDSMNASTGPDNEEPPSKRARLGLGGEGLPPVDTLIPQSMLTPGVMAFLPHGDCETIIRESQTLMTCINDCTASGNWSTLFELLERDYTRVPSTISEAPDTPITIEGVLHEAQQLLNEVHDELYKRAHNDIAPAVLGTVDLSLLTDGLGELYDADPDVRYRVDRLFTVDPYYQPRIFFNTNGSGKTRLLIEGLCRHWGFYFTTKGAETIQGQYSGFGSSDILNSWNYLCTAPGFQLDIRDSTPTTQESQSDQNSTIAMRISRSLLLSRALILERFFQISADNKDCDMRRRWTHLQLTPFTLNNEDIFMAMLKRILQCQDQFAIKRATESTMEHMVKLMKAQFWVVLDEAQTACTKFSNSLYNKDDGKYKPRKWYERSILQDMADGFTYNMSGTHLILAVSSLSLDIFLWRCIGFKTVKGYVVWSNTGGFDTKESLAMYLNNKLKLKDGIPQDILDRAWRWLRGRYHFTATFAALLLRFGLERADILLNALVERLSGGYKVTDVQTEKPNREEESAIAAIKPIDFSRLAKNKELEKELATACMEFMTKGVAHLTSSKNTEAVELGFARLLESSKEMWQLASLLAHQEDLEVVVNEPLLVVAALQYFQHSLE